MSDKLYFEEIKLERILDINDKEKSEGIVTSVGGQTPNNLAPKIGEKGIKIIGSDSKSIDKAENRSKFSKLLDSLGIAQPVLRFAGPRLWSLPWQWTDDGKNRGGGTRTILRTISSGRDAGSRRKQSGNPGYRR